MNSKGHLATAFCVASIAIVQKNEMVSAIVYSSLLQDLALCSFLYLWGALLPDIDLRAPSLFGFDEKKRYKYHRQITHSILLWGGLFFWGFQEENIYLFSFALGGLTHLLADMLTGSVPIFLWGDYRVKSSRAGINWLLGDGAVKKGFTKAMVKAGDWALIPSFCLLIYCVNFLPKIS